MQDFIQNQIFGMRWLNALIGRVLAVCGLDTTSRPGAGIQFFIYDVIKITILLFILIFIIQNSGNIYSINMVRLIRLIAIIKKAIKA